MSEQSQPRVGVYLDFDNIVISRYNQLHGDGAFTRDKVRSRVSFTPGAEVTLRIQQAIVDVGAILDYAATLGPIAVSRAYADWSAPVNARHRRHLVDRAVNLTQLFPTVATLKNGADIALTIDVMEHLFRLDDLSHIVIVAGDSDYIPLVQRCKQLGRVVVGIGVSGATSSALAAACDRFVDYDSLPGVAAVAPVAAIVTKAATVKTASVAQSAASTTPAAKTAAGVTASVAKPAAKKKASPKKPPIAKPAGSAAAALDVDPSPKARKAATALLLRAMEDLGANDLEWQHAATLKSTMQQLDPTFQERALGFTQFSEFLKSRHQTVELQQASPTAPILLKVR
ncbi:NYN domain-containing protein [Cryobacterium sinapicolor]|uniref:NYN domain-containing protein n=1 Tax=Cryobacterium sinapicolor TaxID=1259236 RepID=A0ABY2JHD9_9MICO|nr:MULTISPECIES: NYN domain-containing protein [Cryobacterium]TFC84044.1 NYN domain-containing protein [Cryobacterium sp. TMT3-29-2]TFD03238.1 NYN domain-containing protein [Cryobacterium sinapicolor]